MPQEAEMKWDHLNRGDRLTWSIAGLEHGSEASVGPGCGVVEEMLVAYL